MQTLALNVAKITMENGRLESKIQRRMCCQTSVLISYASHIFGNIAEIDKANVRESIAFNSLHTLGWIDSFSLVYLVYF